MFNYAKLENVQTVIYPEKLKIKKKGGCRVGSDLLI